MKHVRLSALLALSLSLLPALANAAELFPSDVFCEKVTAGSKAAVNEIIANVARKHSATVANQLNLVYSIHPLQAAVDSLKPTEICASAVALEKVNLNYTYLFTFQVRAGTGKLHRINYMAYTVSIQAHHGVGRNPWGGIPRAPLEKRVKEFAAGRSYKTVNADADLESIFRGFYGEQHYELDTLSLVPVANARGGEQLFLATVMVNRPNPNPFLVISYARGVFLRKSGQTWQAAEFPEVYQLYSNNVESEDDLSKMQVRSAPANRSDASQAEQLVEISQ